MNTEQREIICRALNVYKLEIQNKIKDVEQIFAKHNMDFRKWLDLDHPVIRISYEDIWKAESGKLWERELDIVNELYKDLSE